MRPIRGFPEHVVEPSTPEWAIWRPENTAVECTSLGTMVIPRLFNGLWQLSSPAWGSAAPSRAYTALGQLVGVGLSATDMADHYGDAELLYGSFRARLPPIVAKSVIAATKWCIFSKPEVVISREFVLGAVQERSRRLGGRIELLQFHWYDYSNKDYLVILTELVKITKTHSELVSNIGLCNFDAKHTEEACLHILSEIGEVGLVSNQVSLLNYLFVQYSLVDSRPSVQLTDVCDRYGVRILTYGSLCGGLISEKWLGAKAPEIYSELLQLTPSQRKYFDMIMTWASWDDFQSLLRTLKSIADKHQVDLTNVATRWVLNRPAVAAVIVGTRLGVSNNMQSNLKVFSLQLDEDDTSRLNKFALAHAGRLCESIGDCGHEYR
ncbi:NADP-dependent oxidoreductase domain-containing protein [Rhodocollybia butyracea]|uniref:NADP-dependent oxidoreductase domain-containing protein n=1 Tax=Rhodocollybia butyracea TaxID=206335 RepID=A0A9P5PNQ7_9AGAR|nr:NADP-dependent oxidoreductase domain-containing protein [Rhodocollybia butyracea]